MLRAFLATGDKDFRECLVRRISDRQSILVPDADIVIYHTSPSRGVFYSRLCESGITPFPLSFVRRMFRHFNFSQRFSHALPWRQGLSARVTRPAFSRPVV